MNDYRTVHRFIPASPKYGAKTACGIDLVCEPLSAGGVALLEATDGGSIVAASKGQAFDCKRCTAVIERFRSGRVIV